MTWTIRSIGDAEQNDYEGYTGAGTVPYYLDSTIDYVKYLVCQTSRFVSVAGRNISTDRFNTSLPRLSGCLRKASQYSRPVSPVDSNLCYLSRSSRVDWSKLMHATPYMCHALYATYTCYHIQLQKRSRVDLVSLVTLTTHPNEAGPRNRANR